MPSMGLLLFQSFIDQCFLLFRFQMDIAVPLSTKYIYILIFSKKCEALFAINAYSPFV